MIIYIYRERGAVLSASDNPVGALPRVRVWPTIATAGDHPGMPQAAGARCRTGAVDNSVVCRCSCAQIILIWRMLGLQLGGYAGFRGLTPGSPPAIAEA